MLFRSFVIFRVVRGLGQGRDASEHTRGEDRSREAPQGGMPPRVEEAAQAAWSRLRSDSAPGASQTGDQGFDQEEFLQGARAVYARLQEAWDDRDLDDIAHFTSPELLKRLKEQSRKAPKKGRTELMLVNAKLLDHRQEKSKELASVSFDVLLREGGSDQEPKQSREVWHFARDTQVPDSTWKLESIDQLED